MTYGIEERVDALVFEGSPTEGWNQFRQQGCASHRISNALYARFTFEKDLGELIIDIGDFLEHLLPRDPCQLKAVAWNRLNLEFN